MGAVSKAELIGVEEGSEAEDLAGFARREDRPAPQEAPEELNTGVTSDGPEDF